MVLLQYCRSMEVMKDRFIIYQNKREITILKKNLKSWKYEEARPRDINSGEIVAIEQIIYFEYKNRMYSSYCYSSKRVQKPVKECGNLKYMEKPKIAYGILEKQ